MFSKVVFTTLVCLPLFCQTKPNFTLSTEGASLTLAPGSSGQMALRVSVAAGYGQPIYLVASALPEGISVDLPSPIVGSQTISIPVSAAAGAKAQTFSIDVYAAGGAENHSARFSVTVAAPWAPHWVASWGASAVTPSNESGAYYLTNVSVRQIAHLSIGTAAGLRIRLSNSLAKEPVTFASVHVAKWAGSGENPTSAIVPETDRVVTFSGSESVVLPAGEDIFSDPIPLPLAAGADVAVSFYIPKTSNVPATMHTFGNQTAYFSPGDSTASVEMPGAVTESVRPYLTGIDVDAPGAGAVVALGDSITDGMLSSLNRNLRWTDHLARRLQQAFDGSMGVVNEGIAGNCVVMSCLGPSVMERFRRDVLTVSGVKYLIVLAGGNDIGNSPALLAAQLIDAYRAMVSLAHAQGILVYGATILPFGGSNYFSPAHEQLRQEVNAFIRAGGLFDGVIDFDKALANPDRPAYLLPPYDGDKIRPNNMGYRAMAEAIDLALLKPPLP